MALSDISIEYKTIKFDENEFKVRGLSFTDLMDLFKHHKEEIAAIAALVNDLDMEGSVDTLMGTVFEIAPNALNKAIALAADEPDMSELVAKLPLPVVTEAAMSVATLTFKSEEDLVNFIEGLTAAVAKTTVMMDQSQSSPQTSSSVQ